MKTISELNSKGWYRLLKVVYIAFFVLICIVSVWALFYDVKNYQEDYLVKCNYGNKSSFLAYRDKNIFMFYDYSNDPPVLKDDVRMKLVSACGVMTDEELSKRVEQLKNGTLDDNPILDISKTRVYLATYLSASLWSVLSLGIIIVIFETIRRIFYYVVLGTIKPQK